MSCYSCHHGVADPASIPPVLESDVPERPETSAAAPATSSAALTADDVIQKYVTAIGGADAIRKITSRVEKGSILVGDSKTQIEVFTKAPNKRVTVTNPGTAITSPLLMARRDGWAARGARREKCRLPNPVHRRWMPNSQLRLRLKELFPQIRRASPEQIGSAMCDVAHRDRTRTPACAALLRPKLGTAGSHGALRGNARGPQSDAD